MNRTMTLPESYEARIDAALRLAGASLKEPRRLAAAVRRLSDHYIEHPEAPTPWHEPWAVLAYSCYYFPLNYLRVRGVLAAGEATGFWSELSHYTDFGSGVGTVPLALADAFPGRFRSGLAIERSATTERLYHALSGAGPGTEALSWRQKAPQTAAGDARVTFFSFSLTELEALPRWALDSEALALIEPATHQDSRRLIRLRDELLPQGWHVWAPCTHALPCPLLTHSARDWCHDRIEWESPAWFRALEEHLPMRNRTLTYSYLLLRRSPPPARPGLGRLTGDLQRQKGASKQMVCRGAKREFLSWQHKHGEPPTWPRGGLVRLQDGIVEKGPELRPTAEQCQHLP